MALVFLNFICISINYNLYTIYSVCTSIVLFFLQSSLLFYRIPINHLLINLAVADVIFATFIASEFILSYAFTHPDGLTGTVLCRLMTGGTLGWLGGASSAFTLVVIAIERFYAVMYPLENKGKLTKRKLRVNDLNLL